MTTTLLVLTKGVAANAASRYRYLQYLPFLSAAGFELIVKPLFDEDYYAALADPRSPLAPGAPAPCIAQRACCVA